MVPLHNLCIYNGIPCKECHTFLLCAVKPGISRCVGSDTARNDYKVQQVGIPEGRGRENTYRCDSYKT